MKKKEKARDLIDAALEDLVADLKRGVSDGLKNYLRVVARFPDYSFRNAMLIAGQRPDATQVAGYRAWQSLGRQVRKGEKGIVIIAPIPLRDSDEMSDGDDSESLRFRAVHVFDISQTDGDELPAPPEAAGDPGTYTARLRSLIANMGIALEELEHIPGALGKSCGGRIVIERGLSRPQEFSVLVHELAHEMLHRQGEKPPKIVRETEAEAVAYTVSVGIGLEPGSASSDYILSHDGDTETLAKSLSRIQHAASEILSAITRTAEPDDVAA